LKNPHPNFIPSLTVIEHSFERASVKFENSTITSHPPKLLICKDERWDQQTYNSVDWAAFKTAFYRSPRWKQITYSKLTNGLYNTNTQNHRYYGSPGVYPFCSVQQETITHMLTCQNIQVKENRRLEQTRLITNQKTIGTPTPILESIKHALQFWEDSAGSGIVPSPTRGTLNPFDISLTQAYQAQGKIGWEQFLIGKISTHWRKFYEIYQNTHKKNSSSMLWSSSLIIHLFNYTSSLWRFRNGVLHGHNLKEEKLKKLEKLEEAISTAYQKYNSDPFIISHHLSSIFDKPLQYVLQTDIDYLSSWLRTYTEAVETQLESRCRQSNAAKLLFATRKLPVPSGHSRNTHPTDPPPTGSINASQMLSTDSSSESPTSFNSTPSYQVPRNDSSVYSDYSYDSESVSLSSNQSTSLSFNSKEDSLDDSVWLPIFP
jgi:hypothetical protein